VTEVDAKWINSAQTGDADAFAKLVDAYQVPVYNLCYRMLGDKFDAEDAAQETFIRAYKAMKTYDPKRSFSTWILSISAHYCIDELRRRRLNLTYFEDNPFLEIADPGPTPETSVSESEDQKKIRSLLKSLSDLDRAAVIMFYWYEFSYEEIASALNLTISAVKSRLHRARAQLAKIWIGKRQSLSTIERQSYESPTL
jgi:RNA polymerase sigma-70 factor (ECF subfamily)